MSGPNWELKTDSGVAYPANDIFGWSANSAALSLSDLVPDAGYILTLYSYGFEGAGERASYFSTSDSAPISLIDQDEFGQYNCSRLTYKYTAPENGVFSLSTTATNLNNRHWGWFAFSNESTIPETGIIGIILIVLIVMKVKLNNQYSTRNVQ